MSDESYVSAITIHSRNPVRVVSVPSLKCVDIRIDHVRVTVFHPTDDKTPDVLVQSENQAAEWERLNRSPAIRASK